MNQRIAVIGGGAAGLMAVAAMCEAWIDGSLIDLYEKNTRLWAKVIISGGGRCNVTTAKFKKKELLGKYTRWSVFVSESIKKFSPKKVRKRFEDHGVALKQEEDGRVFPVSNDGKDIVAVFEQICQQERVAIKYKTEILSLTTPKDKENAVYELHAKEWKYLYWSVVVATGWQAYRHTWSTWDGYAFALACGHTITELWPSLNSFMTKEKRLHKLSGLAFPGARLEATLKTGERISTTGPVLLTHFGLSWPNTFVLASKTAFEKITKENQLQVCLSPIAEQRTEDWERLLKKAATEDAHKAITTILWKYLTKRFVLSLLNQLAIVWEKKISLMQKKERQMLSKYLWKWVSVRIEGRREWDEFVTAWGVETTEVCPKTMESLLSPWLYFAGEILNVDGVTWWYNLQASRAMGRAAWIAIAQKHKEAEKI